MLKLKWLLIACVWLCGVSMAYADVAPPPDYTEQCTVAKQQQDGMTCKSCSAGVSDNKCKSEWEPKGYKKACKTWGATVWKEIWCKGEPTKGEPTKEPAPVSDKDTPQDNKTKDTGVVYTGNASGRGCSFQRQGKFNPLGFLLMFILIVSGVAYRIRERS